MKTRIFKLIIIDESGSMQSIKTAAIDSVNETMQTIRSAQKKHEDQEHYVSLVTFNDDVRPSMGVSQLMRSRNLQQRLISPLVVPHCTMQWVFR